VRQVKILVQREGTGDFACVELEEVVAEELGEVQRQFVIYLQAALDGFRERADVGHRVVLHLGFLSVELVVDVHVLFLEQLAHEGVEQFLVLFAFQLVVVEDARGA